MHENNLIIIIDTYTELKIYQEFAFTKKHHIFIVRSEDTFLSFTCEDIGVAMVTNKRSFPLRRAAVSFDISFTKCVHQYL